MRNRVKSRMGSYTGARWRWDGNSSMFNFLHILTRFIYAFHLTPTELSETLQTPSEGEIGKRKERRISITKELFYSK